MEGFRFVFTPEFVKFLKTSGELLKRNTTFQNAADIRPIPWYFDWQEARIPTMRQNGAAPHPSRTQLKWTRQVFVGNIAPIDKGLYL
jgi:hypothetical protein